ncbi:MAG: SpoIIE family protein phosphatase [Armatimonadetes bacterium]|nr:SpoIIE family protein phosphatase [Armatimonadota bacterium]
MKLTLFGLFLTLPALILVSVTILHSSPAFLLTQIVFALFLLGMGWSTRVAIVRHRIEISYYNVFVPFWIFLWGSDGAVAMFLFYATAMAIMGRWKVLLPATSANYLACYLAGSIYQAMGAPLSPATLSWHTLLAMSAAFLLRVIVSSASDAVYIALKEGTPGLKFNAGHSLPDLLLFPVNILAVLVYANWGAQYLLLLVAPIAATVWVLKLALRSSSEREELNAFYNFGETLQASLDREEVLRSLADTTSGSGIVRSLLVSLLNEDKSSLVPSEARGLFAGSRNHPIPVQDPLWEGVLREGTPLLIGNLAGHPLRPHIPEKVQSLLIIPLICGLEAEGALVAGHESPDFFHGDHERFLSVMANQVTSTLARVDLYDRLVTTNHQLHEANLRVQAEMELARKVQMGLLPQEIPVISGCELAFTTIPAGEVGGDYYDFALLSPGRIAIAIGDVSGKGLPAALLMAITKGLFHTEIVQNDKPSAILSQMNRRLCDMVRSDHYVALSVGILDLKKRGLTFANAGQTFPLKSFGGSPNAEFVELGGTPLGIVRGSRYEDMDLTLPPESFLLFYTDGVVEALDREGDFFGFERLQEFVHSRGARGADRLVQELSKAVSNFRNGAAQNDDLTVVAVRIP